MSLGQQLLTPLPGYRLRPGSLGDQALLVKFMQRTYQEVQSEQNFSHLAHTVEQYFSNQTPLWLVETEANQPFSRPARQAVACLWIGNAVDQVYGDRYAHIFLLYVLPEHRRRGIGSALLQYAEAWAKARGDRQIGLQVFQANQQALALYQNLGFQTQSLLMVKSIAEGESVS
jgi:ribosomal protein S18 acetylase RimI-like enzyme